MKNKILILIALMVIAGQAFNMENAAYCNEADIKERYNVYYNNGVNLYKGKKYTSAINEFKKVLRYVPYDYNVKNALYTAYISRAQYFLNTEKQPKKAINDLKSALFYMKYWHADNQTEASKITSTENSLKQLLKKHENLSIDNKFQNAKNLRAQGEIAAAGYDLNILKNNQGQKYAYSAMLPLFDIYKSLNNQQMALDIIREAVKLKPDDGLAHYKYALILDDIKNFDAANDEYTLAFKYGDNSVLDDLKTLWMARCVNNPKDAEAHINLGAIYQKQKQYDLARAEYQKAEAIKPKDSVVLTNLASLYYETKDYNLAIEQYKKALKIKPDDAAAKDGLNAVIAGLSGEDLINYLKKEAISAPYDYDKQFNYAYELHKNKNYPDAIIYYKKAIAINSKMPEPYINIAQIYRLQNENAKANAAISHGLSNLPQNKELLSMQNDINTEAAANLYNSATNYFNSGDYKLALDNYLKIKMQTPEVLYSIASCYFELGQNEQAIQYFKKVLEKTPNDTKAMYFIANAYVNLQNTNSAMEYLNKILAIEPSNNDAKNALSALKQGAEGKDLNMAISFYENKKYNDALSLLNKVLAQNSKNAYAYYYKGAIYDETNKKDMAIEEYKKAINADPEFALSYYTLAVAYDTKEDYKTAVSYYEKYQTLKAKDGANNDDTSKYVEDRLKELKDYLGQQK